MNVKKLLLCLALLFIFGWGIFHALMGSPYIYTNNAKLKKAMSSVNEARVCLEDVVPFSWTSAFTFDPYTPVSTMEAVIGLSSPALKESVSEGMCQLVFVNGKNVVAAVSAYPKSLGYNVRIEKNESSSFKGDGGFARIENGERAEFEVTKEDGYLLFHGVLAK